MQEERRIGVDLSDPEVAEGRGGILSKVRLRCAITMGLGLIVYLMAEELNLSLGILKETTGGEEEVPGDLRPTLRKKVGAAEEGHNGIEEAGNMTSMMRGTEVTVVNSGVRIGGIELKIGTTMMKMILQIMASIQMKIIIRMADIQLPLLFQRVRSVKSKVLMGIEAEEVEVEIEISKKDKRLMMNSLGMVVTIEEVREEAEGRIEEEWITGFKMFLIEEDHQTVSMRKWDTQRTMRKPAARQVEDMAPGGAVEAEGTSEEGEERGVVIRNEMEEGMTPTGKVEDETMGMTVTDGMKMREVWVGEVALLELFLGVAIITRGKEPVSSIQRSSLIGQNTMVGEILRKLTQAHQAAKERTWRCY